MDRDLLRRNLRMLHDEVRVAALKKGLRYAAVVLSALLIANFIDFIGGPLWLACAAAAVVGFMFAEPR